ncbi:MAG: hypothetical protein JXA21_07470 [Anaerolineae bacterium]|nr:hypothetical protein [Anaerolineae bacterium]
MANTKQRYLLVGIVGLLLISLLGIPHLALAYHRAINPAQAGVVITEEVVLTGMTMDSLVVADGGVLVLLGVGGQDVVVQPGGEAYIYGMLLGNALNYGGHLEVYGIVGGYVYTGDGATLVDPETIVIATPPAATPTPLPTPVPGTPIPTPTPAPTATPAPSADSIDLSISLYKSATTSAEREPYEEILAHFADAIYEMSNGAHKVRNVTIYQNGSHARTADVVWIAQEWPCAFINGYGIPGYSVSMGDLFNFTDFTVDRRCGGYVLAHEWGHYYYGVYDEYQSGAGNPCSSGDLGCPRPDDDSVRNSVMNDNWRACRQSDFNWLNFSVPKNQTRNNAQYRVFNASAWETLARPTSQDPRQAARYALRERSYYAELEAAAPIGNNDASLELTAADASTQARSLLNIIWADDTASAAPDVSAPAAHAAPAAGGINLAYQGHIESALGNTLDYPKPLMLVASVANGVPIAKAGIHAGVIPPDGKMLKVFLKDDGLYSGFVTYTQAGTHYAFAWFDNRAGLAEFTEESMEHAPGPNGETDYPAPRPVGEEFFAVANAVITVGNVRADDHGNVAAEATSVTTENVDVTGRIDYAGDVDVFEVIPAVNGKLVLRLSGFAFDMAPRVQILRADGAAVVKTFEFIPENDEYFFASLRGKANETFYVAVQHLDPNAIGGLYDISIGPPLPNVIESPPLNWLWIVLPLIAAGLLALYLLTRRRSAPRQVAAPRRRDYIPTPPRRPQPTETPGESIYKSATEKPDENEEA